MTDSQAISEQLAAAKAAQQACYVLSDRLPEDHDPETPENANYTQVHQATQLITQVVNNLSVSLVLAEA